MQISSYVGSSLVSIITTVDPWLRTPLVREHLSSVTSFPKYQKLLSSFSGVTPQNNHFCSTLPLIKTCIFILLLFVSFCLIFLSGIIKRGITRVNVLTKHCFGSAKLKFPSSYFIQWDFHKGTTVWASVWAKKNTPFQCVASKRRFLCIRFHCPVSSSEFCLNQHAM